MKKDEFLNKLRQTPEHIEFSDVMTVIGDHYKYTPTAFRNGTAHNEAGTNEGSCKIFAFAQLNNLPEDLTLACFGQYYREDVLKNPEGDDHGNIRNFMKSGWTGVEFDQPPLTPKP